MSIEVNHVNRVKLFLMKIMEIRESVGNKLFIKKINLIYGRFCSYKFMFNYIRQRICLIIKFMLLKKSASARFILANIINKLSVIFPRNPKHFTS